MNLDVNEPPQQLDLFASKTTRLSKVFQALESGQFALAVDMAEKVTQSYQIIEAEWVCKQGKDLEAQVKKADLQELANLALDFFQASGCDSPTYSLKVAIGKGMYRRAAEAACKQAVMQIGERPRGWYWFQAGVMERAKSDLWAAACQNICSGHSLVLLGNISFQEGKNEEARECYRRAFCEDPENVPIGEVLDPTILELLEESRELELEFPVQWIPLVGYSAEVFSLPSNPQGQGKCGEFHAALLQARRTGSVEYRRNMKKLAPLLFAKLRDLCKL